MVIRALIRSLYAETTMTVGEHRVGDAPPPHPRFPEDLYITQSRIFRVKTKTTHCRITVLISGG